VQDLLKKLNFKEHKKVLILNAPKSFWQVIEKIKGSAEVFQDIDDSIRFDFIIAFFFQRQQIDYLAPRIMDVLQNDEILWFSYPKKSAKNYVVDFNRDIGWEIMEKNGFAGVRQISIDEDWSAIRFRKVRYIPKMIRK
jgi:hypothetical protein